MLRFFETSSSQNSSKVYLERDSVLKNIECLHDLSLLLDVLFDLFVHTVNAKQLNVKPQVTTRWYHLSPALLSVSKKARDKEAAALCTTVVYQGQSRSGVVG